MYLNGGSNGGRRFAWNWLGLVGDQLAKVWNQHEEPDTNRESD
jgi:hypothetical protein